VEGSPKDLKGNPGPDVESFLQVHTYYTGRRQNITRHSRVYLEGANF